MTALREKGLVYTHAHTRDGCSFPRMICAWLKLSKVHPRALRTGSVSRTRRRRMRNGSLLSFASLFQLSGVLMSVKSAYQITGHPLSSWSACQHRLRHALTAHSVKHRHTLCCCAALCKPYIRAALPTGASGYHPSLLSTPLKVGSGSTSLWRPVSFQSARGCS